jgi:hypothetical protein
MMMKRGRKTSSHGFVFINLEKKLFFFCGISCLIVIVKERPCSFKGWCRQTVPPRLLDWHEEASLVLALLVDEGLVDVWNNTTSSNSSLDEGIQFFVTTDSELKMAWGDTLHLQILGGVSCQFQNLSGEVFKDGGGVDGSGGTDTAIGGSTAFQETVDTTDWELEACPGRTGHWLLLVAGLHGALGTLAGKTFCSFA